MIGRPPKHDLDAARSLALNGIPLVEIAERLQIPPGTLTNRAFREQWQVAQTFGRAKRLKAKQAIQTAKAKQLHSNQTVRQTVAEVIAQNGVVSRLHLSGAVRKASAALENMNEQSLIDNHQALQSVSKSAAHVHGWNQNQDHQHKAELHVFVLSLHPSELHTVAQLQKAGRLPLDASVDQMKLAIASLSESERTQFRNDFDLRFGPPTRYLQP